MKNYLLILLTALSLVGISSCKLDDSAEMMEKEDRLFRSYIEGNSISIEPTASGLYYIEEQTGNGISAVDGNFVLINYEMYLLSTEQLVYTSNEQKAIEENIYYNRTLYGNAKLYIGSNLEGMEEGIKLMSEGGKARLVFKSDLGHGGNTVGNIPAYSSLIIDIELLEVITNPVTDASSKIQAYLVDNEITTDSTSTGLYYIETLKGEGDTVTAYSNLKLTFESSLLDGRKIFEKDTVYFQLGTINNTITQGLNEGISYMKVGGEATIIAPYYLAHGSSGKSYYNDDGIGKIPIPPYSAIVYKIELVDIY